MSIIRQNYSEESEAALNKHINMQLYASYLYQSMVRFFKVNMFSNLLNSKLESSCNKGLCGWHRGVKFEKQEFCTAYRFFVKAILSIEKICTIQFKLYWLVSNWTNSHPMQSPNQESCKHLESLATILNGKDLYYCKALHRNPGYAGTICGHLLDWNLYRGLIIVKETNYVKKNPKMTAWLQNMTSSYIIRFVTFWTLDYFFCFFYLANVETVFTTN